MRGKDDLKGKDYIIQLHEYIEEADRYCLIFERMSQDLMTTIEVTRPSFATEIDCG